MLEEGEKAEKKEKLAKKTKKPAATGAHISTGHDKTAGKPLDLLTLKV